jgi:hypothetical protein
MMTGLSRKEWLDERAHVTIRSLMSVSAVNGFSS